MLTLREFVMKLTSNEHFRVYMPNRDCLGFESYMIPHSAPGVLYSFDDEEYLEKYMHQKYIKSFWHAFDSDEETLQFLEKYGNYIVHSIEISNCWDWQVGNENSENCFNIFITGDQPETECWCCHHALRRDTDVPDPKDLDCQNCITFKKLKGDQK